MADPRAKLKITLAIIAGLMIVAAVSAFYQYRRNQAKPLLSIPKAANKAIMALSRIHQTATKDGVVQWELEAETAELEAGSAKMVLREPRVNFYLDDGSKMSLTAREGVLFTRNNDMLVRGAVNIYHQRYTLETEALAYHHDRRILKADVPVQIASQAVDLRAASMTYDLTENQARFSGRVKGVVYAIPEI